MNKCHTLETYVQKNGQNLNESMKALEQLIGLGIETSKKAVVKTLEMIEEIIKNDQQVNNVQGQGLAYHVCARVWDDLPKVLVANPVICNEKPSGDKYLKEL